MIIFEASFSKYIKIVSMQSIAQQWPILVWVREKFDRDLIVFIIRLSLK
jgi:hypothetical protein